MVAGFFAFLIMYFFINKIFCCLAFVRKWAFVASQFVRQ
ncbi:MAG: hypothetical protein JWQ40_4297 [Segetibacter sp.]|nr:hypothetical protein [Segetibacter sp.]